MVKGIERLGGGLADGLGTDQTDHAREELELHGNKLEGGEPRLARQQVVRPVRREDADLSAELVDLREDGRLVDVVGALWCGNGLLSRDHGLAEALSDASRGSGR